MAYPYRTLELTLISAKDLKNVNLISKMEVYAASSIDGDPRSQQRTPTDRGGGTSPAWNTTLRFSVPAADPRRHALHVLVRCERALGDRDVGEVNIPLKELLDGAGEGRDGARQFVSYQVRKISSGEARGILNLSYKFIDAAAGPPHGTAAMHATPAMAAMDDEPVMAYPAESSSGAAYPPAVMAGPYAQPYPAAAYGSTGASQKAGYGYPPAAAAAGYGYPPAGHGYAAARPAVTRPPRRNKLGMGLGAGLLGGLLIGDMASDAGDYGSGFGDDGGGFDF